MTVRAVALSAALACGLLAPAAHGDPGRRVTVALFGDSTAEAYHLRHPQRDGLAARLLDELVRRGYARGATGLIPAMPQRFAFNAVADSDVQTPVPGGWTAIGAGARPGLAGPSGYVAYTESPGATATAPVDGTQLQVLYEAGAGVPPFSVTAGAASFPVDPSGQAPGPASTWLELPAGTRSITVHGPSTPGPLAFDGVVVHRPPPAGRVQVEVQNLAHAGHGPGKDLNARTAAAVRAQAYDVSILFWGPLLEQYTEPGRPVPKDVVAPLLARARMARESGRCLIASAYPLRFAPRSIVRVRAAERSIARKAGCAYSSALAHLWDARTARRDGNVIIDGVHPTARGYRRIARAMAPELARLVATSVAAGR